MGPSGSGKSTLLQVLGCIRHATAGSVIVDGQPIDGLTPNALSALRCERIGFVFQHYNLLPSLRAWENVALALELRGKTGAAIETASRDILARLGLERRGDAFPSELSGGQKQRVAIARAVVGRPDIILADEPTAALDAASGSEVAKLLASIAHENDCAVVVVTHDSRITGIADRLAYLDDGAILWTRMNVQLQDKSLRESGIHEMEHRGPGSLDASFIRRAAHLG
jgi:putative ABC transport system ATP-binding protein